MNEIIKNFIEETKIFCEDLWVMSETDAPLKPVEWKRVSEISNGVLLEKLKKTPETVVEILELDNFLCRMTTPQSWHSEIELKTVERFQRLETYLKDTLTDIKVYRVGEMKIDIAILGKTSDGHYAGLKTYVVET